MLIKCPFNIVYIESSTVLNPRSALLVIVSSVFILIIDTSKNTWTKENSNHQAHSHMNDLVRHLEISYFVTT